MAPILSRPQCVKITPYFLPLFTYRRHIENKVWVTDIYGTPKKFRFLNTHLCFKHIFSSKRHCCKYSFTTYYWSDTNTLSKLRPNKGVINETNVDAVPGYKHSKCQELWTLFTFCCVSFVFFTSNSRHSRRMQPTILPIRQEAHDGYHPMYPQVYIWRTTLHYKQGSIHLSVIFDSKC